MENLSRTRGTSSISKNSILEVPTLVESHVTTNYGKCEHKINVEIVWQRGHPHENHYKDGGRQSAYPLQFVPWQQIFMLTEKVRGKSHLPTHHQ
jgi:hypothetical protein